MEAIRHRLATILAGLALAIAGALAGCGDDDGEGAVDDVGQAADEAGQAAEEAGEDVGQAVEDADKDVGDKE